MFEEDAKTLKYFLKNGTLNGSVVRLARMLRMVYVATIFLVILILIFRFKL